MHHDTFGEPRAIFMYLAFDLPELRRIDPSVALLRSVYTHEKLGEHRAIFMHLNFDLLDLLRI